MPAAAERFPALHRPRRRRWPARTGAVASVLVLAAAGTLGVEVLRAAGRHYLGAADAPTVAGTFGPDGATGGGADGRAPGSAAAFRLVILGDSTGAGVGASSAATSVGGDLAAGLAAALPGRPVTLLSAAQSGARVRDLGAQVTQALALHPDAAVVLVGANDATHLSALGPLRRQLHAALRRLRAAGVPTVLGSCPDLGGARAFDQPLRLLAAANGRRVAAAETAAAVGTGAVVVPLARLTGPAFRADPATLARDRFHPSDRGYALWAAALLPALRRAAGAAG